MAFDVMIPFREALEAVAVDNETRVVVVTGAGDAFCAGADLEDPGMVPNIDGLTVTSIARRALGLLDDVILAVREDEPAGDRGGERPGDRRRLLPRAGVRHPARLRARVLPRGRDQQRPDRERARDQLPAAARDRLEPRVRHHAHRPGRGRRGSQSHRVAVQRLRARAPARPLATRWPSGSWASAASGSRSPSACCGRAWRPAASPRTWITRASRSSTCA